MYCHLSGVYDPEAWGRRGGGKEAHFYVRAQREHIHSIHTSLGQHDMWEVSSDSQIYATDWMGQQAS